MAKKITREELERRGKELDRECLEHKKAGSDAIVKKDFYETILNSIINGVWVTDKNDVIYYINMGMEIIAGIPGKQIVGSQVLKDFPENTLKFFRPFYLKAKETLQSVYYDAVPVTTPSGRQSYQSGWLVPRIKDDLFDGMICTVEDITKRKRVEKELIKYRDHLEELVKERTSEIKKTNKKLIEEITERKQAEEALQESEEKFRSLAENIPDYITRYDKDFRYLYANPASLKVAGYTEDQIIGKTLRRVGYPPKICDFLEDIINEVFKTRKPILEQFEWESVDGMVVLDWRLYPEFDDNGKVISVLGISRDITDMKKTEHALEESEEKYRLIIENQTDLIGKYNLEGIIQFASPSYCRIFGKTDEELLGTQSMDLVHEEDREKTAREVENLFKPPYRCYVEQRILTKDGWRWGGWAAKAVLDNNNNVISLISVGRDITERKRKEKQFEDLNRLKERLLGFGSLDEKLMCVTDGVVKIFSADFARIWISRPGDMCDSGCMHAKVTKGPHVCRNRERCLHLIASSGLYNHINGKVHMRVPFGCYKIGRVAAGKDPGFVTNDVVHDRRIHDNKWAEDLELVSFAGYKIVSADGITIGVLALFSKHTIKSDEVTLLETISKTTSQVIQTLIVEKALQEAHDELEKRVKERTAELITAQEQIIRSERLAATGQLAASVAHEINSPLQAITLLLGTMKRDNEENKELLDNIDLLKGSFYNIRDTVKNLMDLNRPGKERKQMINVNAIIENTCALMKSHVKKNKVRIDLNLSSTIPDMIASPQQLGHVFLNLINNSVEAMSGVSKSEGKWKERSKIGGDISIKTMLERDSIITQVSDTGPGIAEEDLEHIFDPFFTRKKTMGMGVGLSICYGIIEGHNGTIEAKNAKEGGAVFTVTLPLKMSVMKVS